jgi:hypothetical protein
MIRIFNIKTRKSILIDDKSDNIVYNPKLYEEGNPHVLLELKGINFFHHSETCEDCKSLVDSFGTNTHDWFIDLNGKRERLNLQNLGKLYTDNKVSFTTSDFFYGTRLKLNIDTDTVESLEQELLSYVSQEKYEECAFIRDKLNSINDSQ